MRLVCPSCEAKYEVPDDAIPDTGRDVQCANCGHAWFQMRARAATAAPIAAEALAQMPEPAPEIEPAPAPAPAPEIEPAPNPVAMAGVMETDFSGVLDPKDTADLADAVDTAILSEGQAGAEADTHSGGSDASPDFGETQPEPMPESMPEPLPGPEAAASSVASEEALALALSTTDVVQEQSLDAAFAIVPGPEESPPVADGIAADPSPDAMVDAIASEPVPADVASDAVPEDVQEDADPDSDPDSGSDTLTQTESPAVVAAVATGAAAYAVDESVLAILREEAEREATARRADAQSLETQTDMGLAAGAKKKKSGAKVEAKPSARRDLLPDVEEINSTLRPTEPDAEALGAAGSLSLPARRGFRGGFLMVMTLAILGATLYIVAPRLGAMLPALSDPLQGYVAFIDSMRLHLDGLMRSATVAINGG